MVIRTIREKIDRLTAARSRNQHGSRVGGRKKKENKRKKK